MVIESSINNKMAVFYMTKLMGSPLVPLFANTDIILLKNKIMNFRLQRYAIYLYKIKIKSYPWILIASV